MIDLEKMAEQHKQLFPNANLESQFYKMEEEISEYENAEDGLQQRKERADILIVCAGLYRWCPKLAMNIAYDFYDDKAAEEVNRKWQINLKRKWAWNGKTYHHVDKKNT